MEGKKEGLDWKNGECIYMIWTALAPSDVNQVYNPRSSPLLPFLNRHSVVPKVRDEDAGPAATSLNRQALDQIPGTLPRSAKLVVVFSIQLAEQLYRLKQREMEM